MARIQWVKDRLDNWARWCQRRESGALGYPRQTAFARLGPCNNVWGASVPIDELDASLTDSAVQTLRTSQPHLFLTLRAHYVEGYEIKRVASILGVAESTIKARLEAADSALAQWFTLRAQARQASKAASEQAALRVSKV